MTDLSAHRVREVYLELLDDRIRELKEHLGVLVRLRDRVERGQVVIESHDIAGRDVPQPEPGGEPDFTTRVPESIETEADEMAHAALSDEAWEDPEQLQARNVNELGPDGLDAVTTTEPGHTISEAERGKLADMIQQQDRTRAAQSPADDEDHASADPATDPRRYMKKSEYARYQGVSPNTVHNWVKAGKVVPGENGLIYVDEADAAVGPPGTQRKRGRGARKEPPAADPEPDEDEGPEDDEDEPPITRSSPTLKVTRRPPPSIPAGVSAEKAKKTFDEWRHEHPDDPDLDWLEDED